MNSSKTVIALITGAAIGIVIGILISSEKGSELRDDIADKAKDFLDNLMSPDGDKMNGSADLSDNNGKTA